MTDADVLIENFKLGGLAKFGLDYSTLKNSIPDLSIAQLPASGRTGRMHTVLATITLFRA